MSQARTPRTPHRLLWTLILLFLLAARVPSFAEPSGSDQALYMYVADRIRAGAVPYVDAWDQKPPAVSFLYAGLRTIWPHQSVVALADTAAAALLALSLVLLGRRTIGEGAGWMAAGLALLWGHPSLSRVSGVYVRGQCEVFIAAAVTMAFVLLAAKPRKPAHLALAGVALGVAFWLKYNALVYTLPAALAVLIWPPSGRLGITRAPLPQFAWLAGGFALVAGLFLGYFASHGALGELWISTITYNLAYSGETYQSGWRGALAYLATMPLDHVRADMLWFLGASGAAALGIVGVWRRPEVATVALAWLVATILSIAVNGARDLPQYFVQAVPALAFSAAAGLTLAWREGWPWRLLTVSVVAVGFWKVGVEAPSYAGLRWAGLPQLVENIRFDTRYMTGRLDRRTYLERFKGAQKYDALAIDDLTRHVQTTTAPDDRIFVFGFAPAVYVESGRVSASRFFWSRPIVVQFDAGRPGYGASGLLQDLQAGAPTIVALQKQDWGPGVNSMEFLEANPPLHEWLTSHYVLDHDTPIFSVWRRKSQS